MKTSVAIFLYIFFTLATSSAQQSEWYLLYQNAKDSFREKTVSDSASAGSEREILSQLAFFEENEWWQAGYFFLTSDTISNYDLPSPTTDHQIFLPEKKTLFSSLYLESGIDYNSTDYEILGIASDSLIKERIFTPAAGLKWTVSYQKKRFSVNNYLSFKQFDTYYSLTGGPEFRSNGPIRYISWNFFKTAGKAAKEYNFTQNEISINTLYDDYNITIGMFGNIKYKQYENPNEYLKNYYYGNIELYASYIFGSWDLEWRADRYAVEAEQYREYDRESGSAFMLSYDNFKLRRETEMEVLRYDYLHNFSDISESNGYLNISITDGTEMEIGDNLALTVSGEWYMRNYDTENENENNYYYLKFKPGIKLGKSLKKAIGFSVIWEKEEHSDTNPLYQTDNYNSYGIGTDFEFYSASLLCQLSYEFIKRSNDNFLTELSSYNHPAFIHNITLLLNGKLTDKIDINGIIDYDYDKNRKEGNINTGKIVSLQLSYKLY